VEHGMYSAQTRSMTGSMPRSMSGSKSGSLNGSMIGLIQPGKGPGSALFYLAPCLAVAAALTGCSAKSQRTGGPQLNAAPVLVATAAIRTLPVEVHAIGNVEPVTTITLRAQVSGELSRVFFTEGEFVQKGQILLQIDEQPFQTQVGQAQANLAKDTAQLRQARANLARDTAQEKFTREQALRYSDLLEQGVSSKMQFDQMQSEAAVSRESVQADQAAIESAQAAMDADKAALDRAKLELGYCTIRSPLDGRTGAVAVKSGNLVTANLTEFTTINQVQPTYVTFSVPEKYVPDIRKFMEQGKLTVLASLRDDPSPPARGVLAFVDNTVDLATGTIKLKALFPNEDRKLWPGQFINAKLQLSTLSNALVVPALAIQTGQEGQFVFVVKPDMTVEPRSITPGMQVEDEVVIEKGLQAGERVVTEGQLRLVPGGKVSIQNPGATQSQGAPQS
jgi:multidrug efflux system membrane fusion protein